MTHCILGDGPFARAFAKMPTFDAALPLGPGEGAEAEEEAGPLEGQIQLPRLRGERVGKLRLRLRCDDCGSAFVASAEEPAGARPGSGLDRGAARQGIVELTKRPFRDPRSGLARPPACGARV